ncbi:MAG: type I-U CRISPR-associated protein Csb2, partial [Thermoplasmata archaeon]|nr:type I-U CRISPR-associated protein Csb2 [Thermoplasmata archaeon]
PISDMKKATFQWFESLSAPIMAAPKTKQGTNAVFFVPRNDLDAVQGDPTRIDKIRYPKEMRPWLFDAMIPLYYAWSFQDQDIPQAENICQLAENLYQLGHGIDMAWAASEVIKSEELQELLHAYSGQIYRPAHRHGQLNQWACPCPGTFESLERRYNTRRFDYRDGGKVSRPPMAKLVQIAYNSPPVRCLFELRKGSNKKEFAPHPLAQATNLVIKVRDIAVEKLSTALPALRDNISNAFNETASNAITIGYDSRVSIIPLPSIGSRYADYEIRRILIEVSPNCNISAEDVFWAFSGLGIAGNPPNKNMDVILTRVQDIKNEKMLSHYGIHKEQGFRIWRTVTPAALPEVARRRRIDPSRIHEEAKTGSERADEEMRAAVAIFRELRTDRMMPQIESIHVQREPFESRGMRAELFDVSKKFPKERLWHAEVIFAEPVSGPLIIGNGRFLGLGVMVPVRDA